MYHNRKKYFMDRTYVKVIICMALEYVIQSYQISYSKNTECDKQKY